MLQSARRARSRERRGRTTTSQGSGFAVRIGGEVLILTAAHCVQEGMGLEVALQADSFEARHKATVVGRAPHGLDLALLRLPEDVSAGLAPLELASDPVQLGEFAIAIGMPDNLRPAVSLGIISGVSYFLMREAREADLDRRGPATDPVYVVTDAAFAGGMSGGPLLDSDGRVVGVSTLVRQDKRGIGNYAISARRALEAAGEIRASEAEEAEAEAERGTTLTLVLFNYSVNKRARVERLLLGAGLDAAEANRAMMDAHRRGRGEVRTFDAADEAEARALADRLAAADLLVELRRD